MILQLRELSRTIRFSEFMLKNFRRSFYPTQNRRVFACSKNLAPCRESFMVVELAVHSDFVFFPMIRLCSA